MKLKSFNEHSNKYTFKDKDQLDSMSKEDVKSYRYSIIQNNSGWYDGEDASLLKQEQADWKHYVNELEIYQLVRFKEDTIKDYNRWVKLADDGDKDYTLMGNAVRTDRGKELMYRMSLNSDLNKVGEFKYILGMDIDSDFDKNEWASLFSEK